MHNSAVITKMQSVILMSTFHQKMFGKNLEREDKLTAKFNTI